MGNTHVFLSVHECVSLIPSVFGVKMRVFNIS